MNIVIISLKDFANVGTTIAQSVNQNTNHKAHCITLLDGGTFSYDRDIVLIKTRNGRQKLDITMVEKAKQIIATADILHFKGDDPIQSSWSGFQKLIGLRIPQKPTIVSVEGSKFRRYIEGKRQPYAQAVWSFDRYFDANLRTAMTADLNYPEYNGIYTQQGIDSKRYPRSWTQRKVPVICHSPSIRGNKGTSEFLEAIDILKKDIKLELRLIEGMPNDECIRLKKESTLFFDQSTVGFYGISALEAMRYGIPTICRIPKQHLDRSSGKLDTDIPVLHDFEPTAIGIAEQIRSALTIIDLEQVSRDTKNWMDSFHDNEVVGRMWGIIYDTL